MFGTLSKEFFSGNYFLTDKFFFFEFLNESISPSNANINCTVKITFGKYLLHKIM